MASNVPPNYSSHAPKPHSPQARAQAQAQAQARAQARAQPQRNPDGDAVTPVNAYSNAIDPRKMYPTHFDHLMRSLFAAGEAPEMWRVLDATETRLDEHGMEIEFTLVRHGTDLVWRRSVLVDAGRLVKIETH